MAKYHITAAGNASVCKAQIKCPFGDESLHFETAPEARAAYEAMMSPMAAKIKRSLKSLDTDGLRQSIFAEAQAAGFDVEPIHRAAALATELHEGQFRSAAPGEKRPPYITHPLRNAARMLRWKTKVPERVTISLLHDVVEDSPLKFAEDRGIKVRDEAHAREVLLAHIKKEFGARVASAVNKLSNDLVDPEVRANQTLEEKHDGYVSHAEEAVRDDQDVLAAKIDDVHDNGAGLYHTDFPARKLKTRNQAIKYLKLIPKLRAELERNPYVDEPEFQAELEASLDLSEARLKWMLSK